MQERADQWSWASDALRSRLRASVKMLITFFLFKCPKIFFLVKIAYEISNKWKKKRFSHRVQKLLEISFVYLKIDLLLTFLIFFKKFFKGFIHCEFMNIRLNFHPFSSICSRVMAIQTKSHIKVQLFITLLKSRISKK